MDSYFNQRISVKMKKMIDVRKKRERRLKEKYRCPTPDFAQSSKLPSIIQLISVKATINPSKLPQPASRPAPPGRQPLISKSSTSIQFSPAITSTPSPTKLSNSHLSSKTRSQSPVPTSSLSSLSTLSTLSSLSSPLSQISITSQKASLNPNKTFLT